jgi:antitoxin component YwqK of YwqJK toxin-antitoxin module
VAAAKPVREVIKYGDGTVKARGQRLSGEMHGAWKFFRLDDSLMRSGTFDRGRQVGVWRTFTRDGALVKSTDFGR